MRLNRTRVIFPEDVWNPLGCCVIPASIYAESRPVLTDAELKVMLIGCAEANMPKSNCGFALSLSELGTRTGYKRRDVLTGALAGLCEKRFIVPVSERRPGSHVPARYEFWNQMIEESFAAPAEEGHRKLRRLRAALFFNRVSYFPLPLDAVAKLNTMAPKSAAVFAACARLGNVKMQSDFTTEASLLCRMSGADRRTVKRAADDLSGRLMDILLLGRDEARIEFRDPNTGRPLDVVKQEQSNADEASRVGHRHFTPAQIMAWALRVFGEPVKVGTVGEFLYNCPLCGNGQKRRHRPQFNVNPFKNAFGLWHCFSCERGGTILDRVMSVTGCNRVEAFFELAAIQTQEPELYARAEKLVADHGADSFTKRQYA